MSVPVLTTKVDCALNGDNVLLAAVTGKEFLICRIFFVVAADVLITFKEGDDNALTGPITMFAGGSFMLDITPDRLPWFSLAKEKDFVLNLSAPVQVSGRLYYRVQ